MPEYRYEQTVRIARIHDDLRDLLPVPQSQMLPGPARIRRFVDAITRGQIWPLQTLAATHIKDVRIGRRYRYRANRAGRLVIKYGKPGTAIVRRLPHAAVDYADVEHIGLVRDTSRGLGATGPMRADHAPTQRLVVHRIDGLSRGKRGLRTHQRKRAEALCDQATQPGTHRGACFSSDA